MTCRSSDQGKRSRHDPQTSWHGGCRRYGHRCRRTAPGLAHAGACWRVVVAVNQIEGDALAPVVLGRAVSLYPLAILPALTAGVLGALLSVPLTAVVWTGITTWTETGTREWSSPLGLADDQHACFGVGWRVG